MQGTGRRAGSGDPDAHRGPQHHPDSGSTVIAREAQCGNGLLGAPASEEDQELLAEVDDPHPAGRLKTPQVAVTTTVAATVCLTRRTLERLRLWEPASFGRADQQDHRGSGRGGTVRGHHEPSSRAVPHLLPTPHVRAAASAGDPAMRVEYRVLLRRPSLEASQESNLHDTMQIESDDRRQFRDAVNEVAMAASGGVRGAVESPVEPVRGIRAQPSKVMAEHPAERLERIGRLMYSLLIPDAMQRLIDETCCPLTVISNDLELPWELMHDGEDFLCLKRPFARMPVGQIFPRRTRRIVPPPRAIWNALLVHSDSAGDLGDSACVRLRRSSKPCASYRCG